MNHPQESRPTSGSPFEGRPTSGGPHEDRPTSGGPHEGRPTNDRSYEGGSVEAVRLGREFRIAIDPIACDAHGYCAELLGELVTLDEWGYPMVSNEPVPRALLKVARKAARDCPRRAFLLLEDRVTPKRRGS
jgi:ferredoxin